MELSKYIINSINRNETSIGDNPAIPPEDETKFLYKIIKKEFEELTNGIDNVDTVKEKLPSLLIDCVKNESNNIPALEELCFKVVDRFMPIPEDTISIEAKIVNNVDVKQQRLVPEDTSDFSFDSIDDMSHLTNEIYKRRLLNALINGAAMYYATKKTEYYLIDLFKINPDLPALYNKILTYNNILLYTEKDTLEDGKNTDAGSVDVYIQSQDNMVKIKSQGIIFPILLFETIKGLLELAISHGLPDNREKAEYIIKKTDFKLADNWDMRIGLPLWNRIVAMFEKINVDLDEIELNFLFMQLSMLETYDFNNTMKEIFAGTKQGEHLLADIVYEIKEKIEKDDFDDYMQKQNDATYQIADDEYYEPDELIVDSESYFG